MGGLADLAGAELRRHGGGASSACSAALAAQEVAGLTATTRLPKVSTKQEFIHVLEDWMTHPKDAGSADDEDPHAGRPTDLKAYVLESNSPLRRRAAMERVGWSMTDTGVPDLKIMNVRLAGGEPRQFFVDVSDRRFVTIHTNGKAEDVERVIAALTDESCGMFDNMWMHHGMLEHMAKKVGSGLVGFAMRYTDSLLARAEAGHDASALEDLHINISGSKASRLRDMMRVDRDFRDIVAYRKIRVLRGPQGGESDYVHDDIASTGYFAVKQGKSVQNHLGVVEESKEIYSRAVAGVEDCRLGICDAGGKAVAKGRALNFTLSRRITDIDQFVSMLFNSAKPFKLGGIKSAIEPGYYRVLAVDMHTGDPMTFEIASGMMRIYLSQHSCGNTVLRLLTNLQASYGTDVRCKEVDQIVS